MSRRNTLLRRARRRFRDLSRAIRRPLQPGDYAELWRRLEVVEQNSGGVLALLYPDVRQVADTRARLAQREFRVHSQNGEDGILLYLFSQIGSKTRSCIEFGIGDGSECNSANLVLGFGWSGLLMDCDAQNVESAHHYYRAHRVPEERLRVHSCLVTPENADATFASQGLQGEIDLLTIDVDGNDYWIWRAIESVSPRVVSIEYNASFGPDAVKITPYAEEFDRYARHPHGWHHSASLTALTALGRDKGYALVGCDSAGVNAFFVRRDTLSGELEEVSPSTAFYSHARRLRRASQAEQEASLADLPLADT